MKIKATTLKTTASSYWLNSEFDTEWKRPEGIDYTKLAATQRAIGNFVNIVTGMQIPVQFQSKESSYTDGERVVIGTKLDGNNFDPAVGLALHEGSHIAHTDFKLFKLPSGGYTSHLPSTVFGNIISASPLFFDHDIDNTYYNDIKNLLNWIEDRRIDYKVYTTAPGYRMYYESMYDKYFNDKIIDKALKAGEKTEETIDDYMFHIINLTNPNRNLAALKYLRDIWNVIDLKRIDRLKTTTSALLVACEVYKIMLDAVAEAEPPKTESDKVESKSDGTNETESDGTGDGTGGGGDGFGDGFGEGDDDGTDDLEGEANDNQSNLSQRDQKLLDNAIQKQRDFIDGQIKKTGRLTKSQASTINAIRESGTESRVVATSMDGKSDFVDTIVIKKFTPGIIVAMPRLFRYCAAEYIGGKRILVDDIANDYYGVRDLKTMNTAINQGIILGKQLGRKLQLRNADRTLKSTRLETGKIDRRLISQLGYDNANVFHRIVTDRYKDYFIHISIDASGSMTGNKFRNAITSAVAVAQAASMTTGIRVQISLRGTSEAGNNTTQCVTLYAYDSAHDKISKIRNQFVFLDTFGMTPEGISFKSIEKDLRADGKGRECIFVNYSDGAPTDIKGCSYYYNGVEYTRKIINGFREIGINIISYFIAEAAYEEDERMFRRMYGADASFIQPTNMTDVSRTLNAKFLELAK